MSSSPRIHLCDPPAWFTHCSRTRTVHSIGFTTKPLLTMGAQLATSLASHPLGSLGGLYGEFAAVLHEHCSGHVWLVADHLATRPIYYTVKAGTVHVGQDSSCVSRCTRNTDLDRHHLVAQVVLGPMTEVDDSRSPWLNIHTVRAGTTVMLQGETATSHRYFPPRVQDFTSADDAYSTFASALAALMHRYISLFGRVAATVSGGIDSATIASALAKAYASHGSRLPATVTIDYSDPLGDERRYADYAVDVLQPTRSERIPAASIAMFGDTPNAPARPLSPVRGQSAAQEAMAMRTASTRNGCNALLLGVGGDECFKGNWEATSEELRSHPREALRRLWDSTAIPNTNLLQAIQDNILVRRKRPSLMDIHDELSLRQLSREWLRPRVPLWLVDPDLDDIERLHKHLMCWLAPTRGRAFSLKQIAESTPDGLWSTGGIHNDSFHLISPLASRELLEVSLRTVNHLHRDPARGWQRKALLCRYLDEHGLSSIASRKTKAMLNSGIERGFAPAVGRLGATPQWELARRGLVHAEQLSVALETATKRWGSPAQLVSALSTEFWLRSLPSNAPTVRRT